MVDLALYRLNMCRVNTSAMLRESEASPGFRCVGFHVNH